MPALRFGLEMSVEDFNELFRSFDPDGSGEIAYDEFLDFFGRDIQGVEDGGVAFDMAAGRNKVRQRRLRPQRGVACEEAMKLLREKVSQQFSEVTKAFRKLDQDKSGAIGAAELR